MSRTTPAATPTPTTVADVLAIGAYVLAADGPAEVLCLHAPSQVRVRRVVAGGAATITVESLDLRVEWLGEEWAVVGYDPRDRTVALPGPNGLPMWVNAEECPLV